MAVYVDAKLRNEITDSFVRALETRPEDFSLSAVECTLYDKKHDLVYWVGNGATFFSVRHDFGDEIMLGSGLKFFPLWWPFSGYRAWWAYRKWKRNWWVKPVKKPPRLNRDVIAVIDKIRTDS